MAKMSKVQRTAILAAHDYTGMKLRGMVVGHPRTLEALAHNGWTRTDGLGCQWVTPASLIAAGVDMDAIHAEALAFGHRHDMVESAMTDTCNHGCKVYRCACGETEIRHYASYGCPVGRAEIA